jgi:hypothetical protein
VLSEGGGGDLLTRLRTTDVHFFFQFCGINFLNSEP